MLIFYKDVQYICIFIVSYFIDLMLICFDLQQFFFLYSDFFGIFFLAIMNCFYYFEIDSDIYKLVVFNNVDMYKKICIFYRKKYILFKLIGYRFILIVQVLLVLFFISFQSFLDKVYYFVLFSFGFWYFRFMNFFVFE